MHTSSASSQADPADRRRQFPSCSAHPGSSIARVRAHGPRGPGSYVQCCPADGPPHLLEWPPADARRQQRTGR
jgi:hypothetical protein